MIGLYEDPELVRGWMLKEAMEGLEDAAADAAKPRKAPKKAPAKKKEV